MAKLIKTLLYIFTFIGVYNETGVSTTLLLILIVVLQELHCYHYKKITNLIIGEINWIQKHLNRFQKKE